MAKQLTVLIIGPWYPAGPLRFLSEAFERMGLNVIRVGPTYNQHGGVDWKLNIVHPHIILPREQPRWDMNQFIFAATKAGYEPDFVLISEENYQTDIISTNAIPTVFWTMDGWPNNFARGDALNPTLKYINHPLGIRIHPRKEEAPGWKYLPGAYAPWAHPFTDAKRDIYFVSHATPYGKRPATSKFLRDRNISVADGWVDTEKYTWDYNRGWFTFHNTGGQEEVKWRAFEAAGMGCVNISDDTRLLEWNGFRPYEHYIPIVSYPDENGEMWPKLEDFETIIRGWIGTQEWQNVSDNARKLINERHTYYHRCAEILEDLGLEQIEIKGQVE